MNPVLLVLVLIALVILWFLLSFLFRPIGKLMHRIYKDAADEINRKENDEKTEDKKL